LVCKIDLRCISGGMLRLLKEAKHPAIDED
jgi:hypothetical protein